MSNADDPRRVAGSSGRADPAPAPESPGEADESLPHGGTEDELIRSRERLRTLSRRLIAAQEVERQRIARELHDDIGQTLSAVKMSLQSILKTAGASSLAPPLRESIDAIDQAIRRVRDLSVALRPSLLDDLGLVPAVRWFVNRQAERGGFGFTFEADELAALPSEIETACFRIAQEATNNVLRHAGASHLRVSLRRRGDVLELTVSDDGRGFDVQTAVERIGADASLGLLGMRERARLIGGRVTIESAIRSGTTVRARIPTGRSENA